MALITPAQVLLELPDGDRHGATRALAGTLVADGRVTDMERFLAAVTKREEMMATGLLGGIGIPHARSTAVAIPSLAFGRSTAGIDWGAEDGPATLVFLIAAPEEGGEDHLAILAKLARKLMRDEFKQALRDAATEDEVVTILQENVIEA